MYKIDYQIKLLNNVLDMSFDGKHILFEDNAYGLFLYSVDDRQLILGKRLSKNPTPHHIYSKAASTSKDGYAFLSTGDRECKLYCIKNNTLELIGSTRWHKLDISAAAFSDDSTLVASGGEDGRVYIYNTQDLKFHALCPIQPDYISCLHFDSKNRYLAFGTYEKKILVYDLHTFDFILELDTPSVCMDIVFYNDDYNLFYICNEGEIGFYNFLTKTHTTQKLAESWLQCCLLSKNAHYIYVASRDDKLWIISLNNQQPIITLSLPENGVSNLANVGRYLCICFINGKVILIFLEHQKNEFNTLLKQGDFQKAKLLAEEENIFLKLEDSYTKARQETWRKIRSDITRLFVKNQAEQAIIAAKPYLEDPNIDAEFSALLENNKTVSEFLQAIEQSKYQDAYKIAEKKPAIKSLMEYQNLEDYFEKILNSAKKMLEEDYENQIYRAKKLLQPFEKITGKKERINLLLENFTQYSNIQNALKNQDYKAVYMMAQEYPFLKITKAYKFTLNHYEEMLISLQQEILNNPSPNLESTLNELANLQDFSEDANALKELYNGLNDFIKAAKDRSYTQCYAILDTIPALISSTPYLEMESYVLSAFNKAMAFAQDGNTQEVYNTLGEFLSIKRWKKRLDNVFQISYFYEMKNTNIKELNWLDTLKQYCSFFGKGTELAELCQIKGIDDIYKQINIAQTIPVVYLKTIFKK